MKIYVVIEQNLTKSGIPNVTLFANRKDAVSYQEDMIYWYSKWSADKHLVVISEEQVK